MTEQTKSTSQTIDQNLKSFEDMIRELLELGYSADMAVKIAYKHFPIMELMEEPLTADMVQNFDRGYHSVLVPNGGNAPKITPYSFKSIGEAMKTAWTNDKLTLSERLHGKSPKVREEVAEVIGKSIKQGKSNVETAREIFEGYGKGNIIPTEKLPQYIEKVRKIKWPLLDDEKQKREVKKVIRQTERRIQQNTTPSLRAAYSELVKAVEDASATNVSKAVTVAVQEKARYNAERIARTENARAYADGQMSRYMNDDDVVAFKWRLGSRHPVFDICDFYANADLYGLGKGVYPKDKFPRLPAHPHCMCLISPLYDFEIDITKAKENIEGGGLEYIKSLPKRDQEKLLGIHGREMVEKGKESWTQRARGWSGEAFKARIPNADITQEQPKIFKPKIDNTDTRYLVDEKKINSKAYRDKFEQLPFKNTVNDSLHREAIKCFNAANGRNIERTALIDVRTGKTIGTATGEEGANKVGIKKPPGYDNENSIVVIHNHPNNGGFSRADVKAYINTPQIHGAVVITGMGDVYHVSNLDRLKPIEKVFDKLYTVYKDSYGVHHASDLALRELNEKGWLVYEKVKTE